MAITRRQFVTTLSALAAAMGIGQADLSKITEAFAHTSPWGPGWASKPKVIWVHGAECTGCSTSLLSLFEDVRSKASPGVPAGVTTLAGLDYAVGGTGNGASVLNASSGHPFGHRTVVNSAAVTGLNFDNAANTNGAYIANIADVLIDFIDLQYHETVMGMGGDLAAQWLHDNVVNGSHDPFVLVVEGAIQDKNNTGYWNSAYSGTAKIPWCSIGKSDDEVIDNSMDDVVLGLASQTNCAAVIAIGQCACYGGYPACQSPILKKDPQGVANGASMTGAQGTYDFLSTRNAAAAAKVINAPGCPTNPWWFVLTVVAWLVDFYTAPANGNGALGILHRGGGGALDISINLSAIDSATKRRLNAVYNAPLHTSICPRYYYFNKGQFAAHPGDTGCLLLLGCKGPSTKSMCHAHGWNGIQPANDSTWEHNQATIPLTMTGVGAKIGSACIMAGHPCMGCTEKGYPDAFVPFVVR